MMDSSDYNDPKYYKKYSLSNLHEDAYFANAGQKKLTEDQLHHKFPEEASKLEFSEYSKYVDKSHLLSLEAAYIHLSHKRGDFDVVMTEKSINDYFKLIFGYESQSL